MNMPTPEQSPDLETISFRTINPETPSEEEVDKAIAASAKRIAELDTGRAIMPCDWDEKD